MNKLNMKTLENLGFCIFDDEAKEFAEKFMKDLQDFCEGWINENTDKTKEDSSYEDFANLVNGNLERIKAMIEEFDEPLTKLYDKNYEYKSEVVQKIEELSERLYKLTEDCDDDYFEFRNDNNI